MQNDHIAGTKGNSNKKITQNKFSTLSDVVIFAIPSDPVSLIDVQKLNIMRIYNTAKIQEIIARV